MKENKKKFPLANIIGEISCKENVEEAFDYVVGHLECAEQREKYKPQKAKMCKELQEELATGTFRIREFREMEVRDGPKVRKVQAPRVKGRVGCHAVMVVIEKYTYPTLIKNTAASINGRGMHWLHHIEEDDTHNVPDMTAFYYQSDIYHYYDNIEQWMMKELIREYVSDPLVLPMLDNFIELLKAGLSKGLRSSQCFANLFLNKIDHRMVHKVPRYFLVHEDGQIEVRSLYYRYCDDIVMKAGDKKTLWLLRDTLIDGVYHHSGYALNPTKPCVLYA